MDRLGMLFVIVGLADLIIIPLVLLHQVGDTRTRVVELQMAMDWVVDALSEGSDPDPGDEDDSEDYDNVLILDKRRA